MANEEKYAERVKIIVDATGLKEPSRLPVIPMASGIAFNLYGASHYNEFYDYEAAIEPVIKYHEEFQPDTASAPQLQSGLSNQLAQTTMIDWPGRPGTRVSNSSTHQVIEYEYMLQDEYDELINDYTGFMLRKYFPRSYPALKGVASLQFNPATLFGISGISAFTSQDALKAYDIFKAIAEENQKANNISQAISSKLTEMGFPGFWHGMGLVPFDAISDNFRGTVGMFYDQLECPEKIAIVCDMFADMQIKAFEYLKSLPFTPKRIFFPLHKGMDGFISPKQYEELYWAPFQKILKALVEMGVTPFIYTEGFYNTRIPFIKDQLSDLPKGTSIIHFERGDFKDIKKQFDGIACICGGMPLYLLEWENKEKVIEQVKYLIDNCASGGGYLFNTSAGIDNAKRENIEAMFETAKTYGAK